MRSSREGGQILAWTREELGQAGEHAGGQAHGRVEGQGEGACRRRRWGWLEEGQVFRPNAAFLLLAPAVRRRFVWPSGWNLAKARRTIALAVDASGAESREWGPSWLLLEAAEQAGLVQDLATAFAGDAGTVEDLLTLALFACLDRRNLAQCGAWQQEMLAPSARALTPARAHKAAGRLSAAGQKRFLALLRARHAGTRYMAGISRLGGDACIGIVYAWPAMAPVHFKAFPAGTDSAACAAALDAEAKTLGMPLGFTVFGLEDGSFLVDRLEEGRPFVAAADPADYPAYWRIRDDVDYDGRGRPVNMAFDPASGLRMAQFDIYDTECGTPDGGWTIAEDYVCTLFFDGARRGKELRELDREEALADRFAKESTPSRTQEELDAMNAKFKYHVLQFGSPHYCTQEEVSIFVHASELRHARNSAGFSAAVHWKAELSPQEVLRLMRLRDAQESFFAMLEERARGIRDAAQAREGRKGRDGRDGGELAAGAPQDGLAFAGFAAFLLWQLAGQAWERSERLREAFASPLDAVLAMRSLRFAPGDRQAPVPPALDALQEAVVKAFGIGLAPAAGASEDSRAGSTGDAAP